MSVLATPMVLPDWRRPARSLASSVRQTLVRANGVSSALWGAPLTELARRLPSILRGGLLQSLACYAPEETFAHRSGPAVMLIPGLFCTPGVLNRLGHELERLGCDVHTPRSFPYFHGILANCAPVERSVQMLLNDLETLARDHQVKEITLVGHSLGGVIALATAAKAKDSERQLPALRGVVLLATPLGGTPLAAALASVVPACRDISPGSSVLRQVRAAADSILGIVSSGSDSVVPVTSQQALAAATVCFDDFQHTDFYLGRGDRVARAAKAVLAAITARHLPAEADATAAQ